MANKALRAERLAGRGFITSDDAAMIRVVYVLARLSVIETKQTLDGPVTIEGSAGTRGVLKAPNIAEFRGKAVTLRFEDGRSIKGVVSDEEGTFEASGDFFTE